MNQTKRLPSARFGQLFSIVALALLLTAGLLWQTSQLAHASAQVALPAQDATPTDIATDTATDTTTLTDVLNIPITSAPTATVVATRTTNAPSATATARSTGRATSEAVSDSLGNTTINSATVRTTETVTTGTVTTGTVEAAQIDAPAVLTGTIFANRTALTVQFFLDGQVYELAPRESTGLTLRRASTVVNLYSCEAERPESDDCFWDSYPVRQDGFYEITNGADAGDPASLLLDEAGPPPGDQIWVQNRTGQREQIVYGEGVIELSPSETQQIEVETEEIATLFLRTCVALGGEQACEWAPVNVRTGAYYALVADEAGPAPANATRDAVTLETVAGEGGVVASTRGELEETEETEAAAAEAEGAVAAAGEDAPAVAAEAAAVAPGNTACTPQVQALNVRAGPGFEYLTLGQLYSETGPLPFPVRTPRGSGWRWRTVSPAAGSSTTRPLPSARATWPRCRSLRLRTVDWPRPRWPWPRRPPSMRQWLMHPLTPQRAQSPARMKRRRRQR